MHDANATILIDHVGLGHLAQSKLRRVRIINQDNIFRRESVLPKLPFYFRYLRIHRRQQYFQLRMCLPQFGKTAEF